MRSTLRIPFCVSLCCEPQWALQTALPIEIRHGTGSLGHRVNGSFGSSFTSGSPGHRIIILTRCETRVFPVFEKCPKCETYIWNAKMSKVIVKCLLLDWNHWMSVLWLLKIVWPGNTSSHISLRRHLEFIIEQGHRVNGVPGRWILGSLGRWITKCDRDAVLGQTHVQCTVHGLVNPYI